MGFFGDIYDSTIGEITGSNRAADAAGATARAQEAALARGVGFAQEGVAQTAAQQPVIDRQGRAAVGTSRQGLADARRRENQIGGGIQDAINSATSPAELAALTASLAAQGRNLVRQEQVLANIDPAVMEAAKQSLAIMQGQESQFLDPIRQDRLRQREKVVANLREQMGPGAETSTAGRQALNQFDQQTNMVLNQQRQQTLGQMMGFADSGGKTLSAMGSNMTTGMNQVAAGFGNAASRASNTRLGGLSAAINAGGQTQGAFENVGSTQLSALDRSIAGMNMRQTSNANLVNAQSGLAAGSGSQYVAQQLRGQAQNQFTNDRIQSGENMAAQSMGSMSSGGGMMSMCCFIFLEARYADGTMDSVVRRFRDENMTPRNRRGYYKVSEVLVPLMRKYPLVKFLTRVLMTDPLVSYGKYHYDEGKVGKVFTPVKNFWLKIFDYLGQDHTFIRENGETV